MAGRRLCSSHGLTALPLAIDHAALSCSALLRRSAPLAIACVICSAFRLLQSETGCLLVAPDEHDIANEPKSGAFCHVAMDKAACLEMPQSNTIAARGSSWQDRPGRGA